MDSRLAIDTAVLLAYFVGIVSLGLWAGRRNRSLEDFSLGSRSIPWWAVLASIVAAETSAATFLGTPAEGFKTREAASFNSNSDISGNPTMGSNTTTISYSSGCRATQSSTSLGRITPWSIFCRPTAAREVAEEAQRTTTGE